MSKPLALLDTDVLIDVLRGHEPALAWFSGLDQLPAVPGYVVMELIQDAERKERVERAMKLVEPLPIVWPTAGHCEQALALFREYHLSHGLGLLDA